jgi:peptide/nickel transport system permease protein
MAKTKERTKKKSGFYDVWRRLKKNKGAVISMFLILVLLLVAIFADVIAPFPYDEQNYDECYAPHSAKHLLGTDKLGRDVLSRLIYGARQSLMIGIFSVAISAILGMFIGAIAGYFGGWVDNILMRFLDIYQSIPMMLLCIVLSAVLGPSLRNTIIALGVSMTPQFARLMRASILTVRDMEYVEAAKSIIECCSMDWNCGSGL